MGLWVRLPTLEPGEIVQQAWPANHSRGTRAVGGKLFLTDLRLIFAPNAVDRLTGQGDWSCSLKDVTAVGIADRTIETPFSGSIRKRLRIATSGGEEEFFVVNHAEDKVAALDAARGRDRS
jgi:hypothetical protein